MTVTVAPDAYTLVAYDPADIARIFADVAERIGLPDDLPIAVEVDETVPLARIALVSVEPVVVSVEGGAFENPRHLRHLSEELVTLTAARFLGRLRDRLDPSFGEPPAESALTLAQADAWDAYTLGRAQRLGYDAHQPRWRYRFRTRHGFTDAADLVFDRLWATDGLRWAELDAACAETAAARDGSRA